VSRSDGEGFPGAVTAQRDERPSQSRRLRGTRRASSPKGGAKTLAVILSKAKNLFFPPVPGKDPSLALRVTKPGICSLFRDLRKRGDLPLGSLSEGAVAQRLRESPVLSPGADRGDSFRHGGKPPCHLPQGGRQCTGAAFRDLRERASRPFGPLAPGPFMGLKGAMECGKRASLFSAPLPKGGCQRHLWR